MKRINKTDELRDALVVARQMTKAYGSSYYTSTLLFPKKIQEAVFALYALVRKADEIVDSAALGASEESAELLRAFNTAWHDAYDAQYSSDPVLYAASWTFHQYGIPLKYSDAFFNAMQSDTQVTRYQTYRELEQYMYGSAAVVGLMLTCIIGAREGAEDAAMNLGYAMQLTNFLRDIGEDYQKRGRIYVPQEDLERFGVTEKMIQCEKITLEFKELMKFEIARARALYESADTGIPLLTRSGQKPVRLARVLYSKILDRIEDADYDVFSKRRYTTRMQKIRYALPILVSL